MRSVWLWLARSLTILQEGADQVMSVRHKGINPFTKELCVLEARPALKTVEVHAAKKWKLQDCRHARFKLEKGARSMRSKEEVILRTGRL